MSHPPQPMGSWPPIPTFPPSLPPKNTVDMTREMLIDVLTYFSSILPAYFGQIPIRLVVHGGAAMLLNPRLNELAGELEHEGYDRRKTTRDVDVILRSFDAEYSSPTKQSATETLRQCVYATAHQFRLGADWMNCDADIALPMALTCALLSFYQDHLTNILLSPNENQTYDPIHFDAITPHNMSTNTVFVSPNTSLTLVSVSPLWAIALKLVRYTRRDAYDICLILRDARGTSWTPNLIEEWIEKYCWPMGYSSYDRTKRTEFRQRTKHVVELVDSLKRPIPEQPSMSEMTRRLEQLPFRPSNQPSPAQSQHPPSSGSGSGSNFDETPVGVLWSPPPQHRQQASEPAPFIPSLSQGSLTSQYSHAIYSLPGTRHFAPPPLQRAPREPPATNSPYNPYLAPKTSSWGGTSFTSSGHFSSDLSNSTPAFFPANFDKGFESSLSFRDNRHGAKAKSHAHDRERARKQESRLHDRVRRQARQIKGSLWSPTNGPGLDHSSDVSSSDSDLSDSDSDSDFEFVERPSSTSTRHSHLPDHLQSALSKPFENEPAPVIPELHNRFYHLSTEESSTDPADSWNHKPRRVPSWAKPVLTGTEIPSNGPQWAPPSHVTSLENSRPGNILGLYDM